MGSPTGRSDGQRLAKTSWRPIEPEPFYRGLGLEPTGEMEDDGVVARLVL